jgi:hypothetical protein
MKKLGEQEQGIAFCRNRTVDVFLKRKV